MKIYKITEASDYLGVLTSRRNTMHSKPTTTKSHICSCAHLESAHYTTSYGQRCRYCDCLGFERWITVIKDFVARMKTLFVFRHGDFEEFEAPFSEMDNLEADGGLEIYERKPEPEKKKRGRRKA
jgi:hypothetical protein